MGAQIDWASVVRAEIHPAIGMARVGNSANEFFLAPEVPDPPPEPPGFYRDAAGALKRQAVRFRVFGYNAAGVCVAEITADHAEIAWTAHLANTKAAWYEFQLAMDDPAVTDPTVPPARRRNSTVTGADRRKLVIDPGPRTITGRNVAGPAHHFDTGRFFDLPVDLGEVRTDDVGRLILLGGRGVSRSAFGAEPTDFANNDGWHDDVADGPVSARVVLQGRELPVAAAWAAVGPPNYAPPLKSVRTLADLIEDLFDGPTPAGQADFARDIRPVFERMSGLQWVNAGFAEAFGWGGPYEFLRPDLLARLAAPPVGGADPNVELRQQIAKQFRDYATNNGSTGLWPWVYGDAMGMAGQPHENLALSRRQLARLRQWAAGDFTNGPAAPGPDQPTTLTAAALSFCLADAFHPGCEITWVIRQRSLYRSRLRFKLRPPTLPEPDYGPVLTPMEALAAGGPLSDLMPGGLTRWMAVPWQTDTASCRSGYRPAYTPATPSFWPARVPNHALTEADYQLVLHAPDPAARLAAFRRRPDWLTVAFGPGWLNQIRRMVGEFGTLPVVEPRPGPGGPEFPAVIYVASQPPGMGGMTLAAAPLSAAEEPLPDDNPKANRFHGR